jgi:serine/threonine-protein kinase RsbW
MSPTINKEIFSGHYKNLVKIAEFIRKASREAGFDDATTYQVETAIDEACTNIIEHSYGGEGIGNIECAYRVDSKGLTITLEDGGKTFNPNSIEDPDLDAPLEERKNNGLGLYFIRKLMDEVYFEFNNQLGNKLTLVKRKE